MKFKKMFFVLMVKQSLMSIFSNPNYFQEKKIMLTVQLISEVKSHSFRVNSEIQYWNVTLTTVRLGQVGQDKSARSTLCQKCEF